jgi:hypothetical protein
MDSRAGRQGAAPAYAPPEVGDLGRLVAVTQSQVADHAAYFAQFGVAFALSTVGPPVIPGGSTEPTTVGHITNTVTNFGHVGNGTVPSGGSGPAGGTALAGGGGPSGGASASGGSKGTLPFTGFRVIAVVGIGMAMTAAGEQLRRLVRR